ncbi:uncharacterized protein LOC107369832 [Tetranychus urticae]|nr:uncharacterized protein LOC107369832 [Tetranychus urticae]
MEDSMEEMFNHSSYDNFNGSTLASDNPSSSSPSSSNALLVSIGQKLYSFRDQYSPIHGYLSLCICFFGTVTNILNIIVLTRKELLSATNNILTGLAVADMLVMMDYIPFAIHNNIQVHQGDGEMFTYGWTVFTLFHAHFTLVVHSISTWLTVLLAVWRYLSVRFPTQSRGWCTMSNARWLIVATYICIPIFFIPTYLTFVVKDNGAGGYKVDWSDISINHNETLKRINFWVFSVGTKLVPCILLTYLSWALIHAVLEADKRKRRLKENCYTLASSSATKSEYSEDSLGSLHQPGQVYLEVNSFRKVRHHSTSINGSTPGAPVNLTPASGTTQSDRTTRMLLGILLLFLATEFPTGFIALLTGILGDDFFHNVYYPLGDILDTLALINSAVNFVLYCTMSEQFRYTFAKLFFL